MGRICVKGFLYTLLGLSIAIAVQAETARAASVDFEPGAYTAVLDCPSGQLKAPVGADGKFTFKSVSAGDCKLTVVSSSVALSAATDNASARGTSVKSPRDAASGLPTGKRTHKPLRLQVELDGAEGFKTQQQDDSAWEVAPAAVTIKGKAHELKGHVTLIK